MSQNDQTRFEIFAANAKIFKVCLTTILGQYALKD